MDGHIRGLCRSGSRVLLVTRHGHSHVLRVTVFFMKQARVGACESAYCRPWQARRGSSSWQVLLSLAWSFGERTEPRQQGWWVTLRWPPSDWEVVNGAQALHALSFLHGSSPAQTGAAHWPASGTCHMCLMNSGQQGWMVMAEVLGGGGMLSSQVWGSAA